LGTVPDPLRVKSLLQGVSSLREELSLQGVSSLLEESSLPVPRRHGKF
jgi:hypothetical protein